MLNVGPEFSLFPFVFGFSKYFSFVLIYHPMASNSVCCYNNVIIDKRQ